ncbi:hypothetical protein MATL_G00253380 [Megalops atlanticus]|uniref:Synenkephalin n=1 Tax=Megalops atlanticus TaxID=7932 RepID=A0A9D3T056_MEGAT|nr:hypothetical protein MATL_G00253380 [Megalops atlanticus]
MARMVSPYWTLLAVSACLVLTVQAGCGKDCALCLLRLQGLQPGVSSLTCAKECGGLTMTESLDLCKETLQGKTPDSATEEDRAAADGAGQNGNEQERARRYGGFMKRYGGFMKKSGGVNTEPEDTDDGGEIPGKRYGGFMKKGADSGEDRLNMVRELLTAGVGEGGGRSAEDGEILKRYGGFMRAVRRTPDLDDDIKELQKRYGGFMRRVGRPDWEETQKKYGGFLKRSRWADEEALSPLMEKRYGGFMD